MVHTLLIILKIIGMILLILLAVLILLIMAVLLVPVRYRGNLEKRVTSEVAGAFQFTWLFRFLRGQFTITDKRLVIKIFFFTLYDSGIKKEDKEQEHRKEDKEQEHRKEGDADSNVVGSDSETKVNDGIKAPHTDSSNLNFKSAKTQKLDSIKYTIKKLCDKIKEIVNNISYYLEILKSDEFFVTRKLLSEQLLYLIRHLKPRMLEGHLNFGFEDPAYTGYGMAVYGMFYPIWGNTIRVEPDFENEILELELRLKGRARVIHFVHVARKIFFSREGRIVFRKIRK